MSRSMQLADHWQISKGQTIDTKMATDVLEEPSSRQWDRKVKSA